MTQVAIITGGTRGIGLAISKALVEDGMKLAAIFYGDEEAAERFRHETGQMAVKYDVADFEACEEAVKEIQSRVGPADVLVNNAGVTRDGMLHKMPRENWDWVININLGSCFNMCRVVVPGMRERGYGRIINISSINAQKGQVGQTNYSAAKAGMIGFTKALALESANKGITVNVICPGYIETDMTGSMRPEVLSQIVDQIPTGRMGQPEEIAALVSFLTSEKAGFITGTTLAANGGQYLS
ncbi:MAG: acetoacetyl-CoA reductase [Alphaproteobacteria bacterium]